MQLSRKTAAPLLRMVGPLIQVACLIALFRDPGGRSTVAGVAVRTLAYYGLGLGFVLVALGLLIAPSSGGRDRTWRL
ncbi:hypothetical protein EP7_000764 [Isosphaeraceae bacterium EP7]